MRTFAFIKKVLLFSIVYLLVSREALYALTCSRVFVFDSAKNDRFVEPKPKSIKRPLLVYSLTGKEIIDKLSEDRTIERLYAESAGVWEGYSIRQHTQMVFDTFDQQVGLFNSRFNLQNKTSIRLFTTLKFAIALHDIGKPLAIQAGDKNRQHEFTIPILVRKFREFEYTESEILLAKSLVENDILGDLAQYKIDVNDAMIRLQKQARLAGVDLQSFIHLQFLFYTIDAASYPTLRARVFTEDSRGMLSPVNPNFKKLLNLARRGEIPKESKGKTGRIDNEAKESSSIVQAHKVIKYLETRVAESVGVEQSRTYLPEAFSEKYLDPKVNIPERFKRRLELFADENVDIRIHVRESALMAILSDGQIKNRWEGGANSIQGGGLDVQNVIESSHLGMRVEQYQKLDVSTRPHYGLIAPKVLSHNDSLKNYNDRDSGFVVPPGYRDRYDQLADSYGPIVLILDVKDYKDRLTISAGDSANSLQSSQKAYNHMEIKWRPAVKWDDHFVPWKYRMLFSRLLLSDAETLAPRSAPWLSESRDWYYREFINTNRKVEGLGADPEYFEAQIWGPVKKIKAIEVSQQYPLSQDLIDQLTRKGIEIIRSDRTFGRIE